MRQRSIDNSWRVNRGASAEAISAERNRQAAWILGRLLDAAIARAKSGGFHADSDEAEDLLGVASKIASDLRSATIFGSTLGFTGLADRSVSKEQVYAALTLTSRADPHNLISDIRRNGRMGTDRASFEGGIAQYLDSAIRDPEIDAVLLIAAADLEITAFLDEMLSWKPFVGTRSMFDLYRNRSLLWIWIWFKCRGRALLFSGLAIAGFITSTSYFGFPSGNVTFFAALGIICLNLLTTVVTLVEVLCKSRAFAEESARMMRLVQGMVALFGELHVPGALSVGHLRLRFTALQDAGAIWPNSVWTLLDDMDERGVRSLYC